MLAAGSEEQRWASPWRDVRRPCLPRLRAQFVATIRKRFECHDARAFYDKLWTWCGEIRREFCYFVAPTLRAVAQGNHHS